MSSDVAPSASSSAHSAGRVTPDELAGTFSGPADLSSDRSAWSHALLRRWTGTSPAMTTLPLDYHLVIQHLGGTKKCERRGDGASITAIVECGALSVAPAGTEFKWNTQGPIGFAHLYLSPAQLATVAARFDRANSLSLIDRMGQRDPLLEALYTAMLAGVQCPGPASVLYLDSLLETFMLKLLRDHSNASLRGPKRTEMLPPYRLRRVIDFIEANLGKELMLNDLAQVAGGSVFHFSRAFKNALGDPPYRYLLRRRIERAKLLLTSSDLSLTTVALSCGFQNSAQFSKAFSRLVGVGPERYRRG